MAKLLSREIGGTIQVRSFFVWLQRLVASAFSHPLQEALEAWQISTDVQESRQPDLQGSGRSTLVFGTACRCGVIALTLVLVLVAFLALGFHPPSAGSGGINLDTRTDSRFRPPLARSPFGYG